MCHSVYEIFKNFFPKKIHYKLASTVYIHILILQHQKRQIREEDLSNDSSYTKQINIYTLNFPTRKLPNNKANIYNQITKTALRITFCIVLAKLRWFFFDIGACINELSLLSCCWPSSRDTINQNHVEFYNWTRIRVYTVSDWNLMKVNN